MRARHSNPGGKSAKDAFQKIEPFPPDTPRKWLTLLRPGRATPPFYPAPGTVPMENTFLHKLLLAIFAGFIAACLLWGFRHIIQRAFYESNDGWREMFHSTPSKKVR
jgi:hypothetical protein